MANGNELSLEPPAALQALAQQMLLLTQALHNTPQLNGLIGTIDTGIEGTIAAAAAVNLQFGEAAVRLPAIVAVDFNHGI